MDAGEYVYYTNQWVTSGSMHHSIDGWAGAYPFFPGLFSLSGSFHMLTGVGIYGSVSFTPVVLSSLVPLVAFLLTYRITLHKLASLLSASFLTFIVPFVYSQSQPKPETLGFFLMISILWMTFMVSKQNWKRFLPLLILFSGALIITHHLTSFFLILFLLGGYFFSELFKRNTSWNNKFRLWLYLGFTTATILYWFFGAPVFREQRLMDALWLPSYTIVLAPYVSVILAHLMIRSRRRKEWIPKIDLRGNEKRDLMVFSFILAITVIAILIYSVLVNIPGTDITLGNDILFYSPLSAFGIFALFSGKPLRSFREGVTIQGWLLAVSFTFILGAVTGSSSLYTIRQVAFFMLPLAILFGIGMVWFYNLIDPFSEKKKAISLCIILLLGLNLPLMYPSQETAGGYVEWVEYDTVEASFWVRDSTRQKILTDHRLSGAVFSTGSTDLSWTDGESAYFSDSIEEAKEEVLSLEVRYIMMDDNMIQGAAVREGTNPRPMDRTLLGWYRNGYNIYQGEYTDVYFIDINR